MKREQLFFFDEERLTVRKCIELTIQSLIAYGERYAHWAIAYSGGKDSSATVSVVVHLIEAGLVPRPKSLTVLYSDTRMELPPLQISALQVLEYLQRRGIQTRVVLPELDDRFFVYMFGRGVPPPKNRFRWCTPQLKVEPMLRALTELRDSVGEKILMLTGVRVGESAARDQRISLSCGRDGAECGQGWFQETTPESIADTLAPLLHWRSCHVWDVLMGFEFDHGLPTQGIARIYGQDVDGSQLEKDARTGCVGCNLASQDLALMRVLKLPEWAYLTPLLRLRPLYQELTKPQYRLRKIGETKADGSPVSNPGRMGPLTMEARRHGLREVKVIQDLVNGSAVAQRRPVISLVSDEECSRIEELISANTWPNRWRGDEITGDVLLPMMPTKGGGVQHTMAAALESA